MFRGLMFEAEADLFRRAGIQIGASNTEAEENLTREALAPFGLARRNNALAMARLYAVLFCFENEIRDFIREALEEKEGPNWQEKLPPKIKEQASGTPRLSCQRVLVRRGENRFAWFRRLRPLGSNCHQ